MMVTGLPFSLKSPPVDGLLTKSLSRDSETIQPLSFGEILKAKAKQLEQEINVSSAVVALAAMQTSSLPLPMLDLSANKEIYTADIQPALEKGLPQRLSAQPSSNSDPSQIGKDQEMILAGIQKDGAQVDTSIVHSTSVPFLHQLATKTVMPAEVLEAAVKSLSRTELTVFSIDTDPDQTVKTGTIPIKADVNAEVIQGETPHPVGPQTLSEGAAKPLEAKLSGPVIAEAPGRTGTPAVEVHSAPTPGGQEIVPANLAAKQKTIMAETKNEDANMAVSVKDFPESSARVILTTETSAPEEFTASPSLPSELPTDTLMRHGVGGVSIQPVTHEEIVSILSTEYEPMTASQAAPDQKVTMTEVEKSGYQPGKPVSQSTENVVEETVLFDSDTSIPLEVETSSPSSNSKPDLGSQKISTQTQSSTDFASLESIVEQETIHVAAEVDMSTFSPMAEVQQVVNETSKIDISPVDDAGSTERSSIGQASGSLTNNIFVETQKVGTQNTLVTPETDTQSPQVVNRSATAQTKIDQENVKVTETETTEQGRDAAVTDEVRMHASATKSADTPGTTPVQTSPDRRPIQHETSQENTRSTVNSIIDPQLRNEPQNSHRIPAEQSAASSASTEQNDLPGLADTDAAKTAVKARKYLAQDHKPVSAPGNLQPDNDVVVQPSSETDGTHGIEEVKAHTSVGVEEISIPLDRPEFEFALVGKEIRQEKAGPKTEAVISEPGINGTSNEALRSKSGTVSTSKGASHKPSAQAAVLQPQPDVQQYQDFESQQNISFERETDVSQTSRQTGGDLESRANMMFATDMDATNQDMEASHQSVAPAAQTAVPQSESDVRGAQSGANQTKTSFEKNGVETQASVFESMVNVSPDEPAIPATTFTGSGTDGAADDVITQTLIQEASSAAFRSASSNVALSQVETGLEKPLGYPQQTENRMDSNEAVIETSRPLSDRRVISSAPVKETETESAQTQVPGQSVSLVTTDLEVTDAAPLQIGTDQAKPIVDPKHVDDQIDVKATTINVSKPDFEVPAVVVPSQSDTHTESEFVKYQAVAEETPLKAGTDQERPIVNLQDVEKFVDADEVVVETVRSGSDSPATGTSARPVTDIQVKNIGVQPVAETTRLAQSDVSEVRSFPAGIAMEEPSVKPQIIEQETVANESEKASQNASGLPVASYDAFMDGEPQAVNVPIIAPETSPSANVTLPDVVPFQAESGLEKPDIDPENIEKQVKSASAVVSQTTVKPIEKTESTSTTDVDLETSDHGVVSVRANQTPDTRRTLSEGEVRTTIINEASQPASVANKQQTPVSVQPDVFTKVDSGNQGLRANRTSTSDEKIFPVEKQYEPNEKLESASVTTNLIKESAVIGSVEKRPTIDVDPHSVEIVEQVMHQLNGRIKSGPTSMHLQLNPEQLGAIEVEMVRNSQGVSVTFFAEQASTGKLLESQLNQLRQSLVDSGVQLSGLNIGQHHSGQEGGFLHQNTNFAQTSQRETHQREVKAQESPRSERVTGQMSEVDYLI